MIKLIKNVKVYSPYNLGIKDVLILDDKIAKIADNIPLPSKDFYEVEVIDACNQLLVPGFIDLHVHIIGGGGEGGFTTRTPEIQLTKITSSAVTTVVGCLGTDGTTRSLQGLLAKSRALEIEGINCLIWTGCYEFPTRTITKSCRDDIILIDKVIGAGEIAIADNRGSNPSYNEIERLVLECRVGGMLASKCGILHVHVGDEPEGIKILQEIISSKKILANNLLPTHINRRMSLLFQSINYIKSGGFIDLTTGIYTTDADKDSIDASYACKYLIDNGCSINNITMSSDGNGSMPLFNKEGELDSIGVGSISTNFVEFMKLIKTYKFPIEEALLPFTLNPSKLLKLNYTGSIGVGKQADLVILNKDLSIDYVLCKGKIMVQNGLPVKFSTFEKNN